MSLKKITHNITLIVVAILTTSMLHGCSNTSEDQREIKMDILQNQPLFELKIKSFGVSYGALINGNYVQIQFDPESKEDLKLPINHYFTSGKNQIGIKVMPNEEGEDFNPSSYVELTLTTRSFGSDITYPLLTMSFHGSKPPMAQPPERGISLEAQAPFNPSNKGSIEIEDILVSPMQDFNGGLAITQNISIPSSLPRWKFLDSEDIPLPTSLSDSEWEAARLELFKEYMNIHNALITKDIARIAKLFEERSNEMDQAFYEPSGTTQKQLIATLTETVTDNELTLASIEPDILGFAYTESSKLRELTRGDNGAAITYEYKDGGSRGFPIIFRRENGKWIITR